MSPQANEVLNNAFIITENMVIKVNYCQENLLCYFMGAYFAITVENTTFLNTNLCVSNLKDKNVYYYDKSIALNLLKSLLLNTYLLKNTLNDAHRGDIN